jgi:thymidylate synthase
MSKRNGSPSQSDNFKRQTEEAPPQEIDYEQEWNSRVEALRLEIGETEEAIKRLFRDPEDRQLSMHTWNLRIIFEDLMEYINSIHVED